MNLAADLFTPAKYRPRTNSTYLDNFLNDNTYSTMAALTKGERAHRAYNFKFVNPDNFERIGNSVDAWLEPFEQRVKTEKRLAKYIREVVAPHYPEGYEIADKMDSCRNAGTIGLTRQKDDSHIVAWEHKCSLSRLCPHEAGAEAKRLERFYAESIHAWKYEKKGRRFQKAVFTMPNIAPGELHAGIRAIFKMFNQLRRRKVGRSIKGVLASVECPLSVHDDWNVHLNVLMGIEGRIEFEDLQRQWSELVCNYLNIPFEGIQVSIDSEADMIRKTKERFGLSDVTDRQVLISAIRECIKYPAKHVTGKSADGRTQAPGMDIWPCARFIEFNEALKRYRRSRSYDAFYLGKDRVEHEKIDFSRVQWAGSVEFSHAAGRYAVVLAGRSVCSIQGDKFARNSVVNNRNKSLFQSGAPPGFKT